MEKQSAIRSSGALPLWLLLLAVSVLINFIDRGNLAVAAPLLEGELRLTNTQIGVLVTAFFWTYTSAAIVSGWIADRFNANWVLAAGFALWSLATAATGVVQGFALLLVCRMMLGAGESVAFPSYGKLIASHVPHHRRGTANALIISGMSLGPAIGTYACGITMGRFGWRPVFVVIGLASLLWLLPWMRFMPKGTAAQTASLPGVSALRVLRERNFWAAAFGHFGSTYPFYFLIVWLPLYLVRERHFTMQQMAKEAALLYIDLALFSLIAARMADSLIRRGSSITLVRKGCMAAGHLLMAAGVLACNAADARLSFAGLMLAGAAMGFSGPNIYVFAQTLAGPSMAGKWTGLQTAVGNLSGVLVGPLTGLIVDRTGRFSLAFSVCAAVAVFGGVCWVLLVGRLEQTAWLKSAQLTPVASEAT